MSEEAATKMDHPVGDISYSDIHESDYIASVGSFPLRDNAKLFLIRPTSRQITSIPLDMEGSYFCASLTGNPVIWQDENRRQLTTRKLHILRQPAGARARRLDFGALTSLAVLIFFSTRWSELCPQGPTCRVGRFLMHGNSVRNSPGDQILELDENGLTLARGLLDIHIDEDIDTLSAEQSVLGLLSWAFAKDTPPPTVKTSKPSLPPKMTIKTRQAADILRRRFENPPTISELSTLVGLNESDLKRCFKYLYGNAIASYSRQKRMEAARDLLSHSTLGVARIALEVGFANPSQFARAFRRHFGINPSQHRRPPQ